MKSLILFTTYKICYELSATSVLEELHFCISAQCKRIVMWHKTSVYIIGNRLGDDILLSCIVASGIIHISYIRNVYTYIHSKMREVHMCRYIYCCTQKAIL